MQTVLNFTSIPFQKEEVQKKEGFRITSRDLDILEFILEMKFLTIEDIHSKFFKYTKQGDQSFCLRWARERVANLVKSEFLLAVKNICHKTLYVVTQKGYFYARNSRTDRYFARPLPSIDGRTYTHDQKIIQIRLYLEEVGLVSNWISERKLSELEEFRKILPTEFRPDAIYITPDGKKIAFELEIARKSKERYQQKIKKYIQLITEYANAPVFEQVHYVCEKESVRDLIFDQTALFQSYFKFTLLNEIITKKG